MRARRYFISHLVIACAVVLAAPASAATINADPAPIPGTTSDGICTLREAVDAANNDSPAGDCEAASGPDVINMPAGAYPLFGAAGDEANLSGDLDVTSDITFVGADAATTTVNANVLDRVFDIKVGATVSISGITITNGLAPAGPSPGAAGSNGGGILNAGTLTLDRVTITGNAAGVGSDGSGVGTGGSGGAGGGIHSSGPLTITNSVIQNNHAGNGATGGAGGGKGGNGGAGGGLWVGSATITDSTISGNSAGTGGIGPAGTSPGGGGAGGDCGGIRTGLVTLTRVAIKDNNAGNGGAAGTDTDSGNTADSGEGGNGGGLCMNFAGPVSAAISDSAITGNHAGNGAGGASGTGIGFAATGHGGFGGTAGGMYLQIRSLTVTGTTIADNTAGPGGSSTRGTPGGGGDVGGLLLIALAPGTRAFRTSAITGNSAGGGGSSTFGNGGAGGAAGGIEIVSNTDAEFSNTTIAGNSTGAGGSSGLSTGGTSGTGGGIAIQTNGGAALTQVTIAQNQIGAPGGGNTPGLQGFGGGILVLGGASIANSILASNTPSNCNAFAGGAVGNGGHNILFGPNPGPSPCQIPPGGDPLLAPLADNGGATKTMALGDGSSALDIIPVEDNCPAIDQRGVARPQFSACDAGAFELAPPPPPVTENPGGGGSQTPTVGEQQQQPTGGPAPDKTPPTIKLLLTKQKLLKALKKGYFAFFSVNEVGTSAADLFASGKDAKGTAVAKRKRVARGTLRITKTGKQKLVVKFTKKARKAFRKRKKVTLQIVLTARDAAGNATKKTARVVLKR